MDEEALKGFEERACAAERRLAALESSMAGSKGEPGGRTSLSAELGKRAWFICCRLHVRVIHASGATRRHSTWLK